jgi:NADPH:quinone reductase-like Zn-dependent oxidoreductase
LPGDLSFEQGAAFPLQGMTALYLIHEYRLAKPGDTVLIHAAAGGLGLLLVQWAKHLGARVIGTVSTGEKAQVARAAGVDEVILYTRQDFVTETKRLTDGLGADLSYTRTREELIRRASDVLKGIHEGWLRLHIDELFLLAEAGKHKGDWKPANLPARSS